MCRNISYPESPFVPYAIQDGLCHRGFPFLFILYQKATAKTIGKDNKEFLFELYKTEVYIQLFVTYIDEELKVYYDEWKADRFPALRQAIREVPH